MKIKEKPEDFIVEEVINLNKGGGDYSYLRLTKKNWNTLDILNKISIILKIPRKYIGFAGNKDRRAITTQYISVYKVTKEKLEKLNITDANLEFLGYGKTPITLGSLLGNRFKIKLDSPIKKRIRLDYTVNYYGEQRFSLNNKDVGKAILLKQFKKACELINNNLINEHLKKQGNDYIGALKRLDRRLLSLYVNAFQSYLWNEVAKKFLKDNYSKKILYEDLVFVERPKSRINIPLISFDTEFKQKNIKKYYEEIMKKENVKQSDYIIKQFPDLVSQTAIRSLFVKVDDLKIHKTSLEFYLSKGSFATIVIKNIEALLLKNR